ncbi:MAG: hypothetical protein WCK21_05720 [Actinomycetota bacterium]
MAWDSARPVPWGRFAKEGAVFIVGMTGVMFALAGQRDAASYVGIVMGAFLYVMIVAVMAKFGYVRKTLQEMRVEAATRPPRQVGRTTAPVRPRPAPTSRTGGTPKGRRR